MEESQTELKHLLSGKTVDELCGVMKELTGHFSCEFAIRSYLDESPDWALRQLKSWVRDKDSHVRRLVSEGTRPRLPWAPRLKMFQEDPSGGIDLLDRLYFDKELYVRRSVANHLNDIAKDHPDLAVSTAEGWLLRRDTAPVRWVVRHALRSLVKDGHVGALRLLGYGAPRVKQVTLKLSPKRLSFGDPLSLDVSFVSTMRQSLMVDFALHRRLANDRLAAKGFKLKSVELQAGERWSVNKRLPIRPISTRRYYDGEHRIELIVNGKSVATESFRLTGAEKARR